MILIRLRVSGVSFESCPSQIAECANGDPIRFAVEPDNQFDPWAIKVLVSSDRWAGERHIGYVPKDQDAGYAPIRGTDGEFIRGKWNIEHAVQPQRGVHLLLRIYSYIGLGDGPHAWIDHLVPARGAGKPSVRLRFRIDGPALLRDPAVDPSTPPTEAESRTGRFLERVIAGHFPDFVDET
jgi:hypothetical protein